MTSTANEDGYSQAGVTPGTLLAEGRNGGRK
jgi:hypothetical protein